MKYDQFVKLRGVGCVAVILVPLAFLVFRSQASKPTLVPPATTTAAPTPAPETQAPPQEGDLSEVDHFIFGLQKQPLSEGTADPKGLKWRVKKEGVVVELRCDKDKGYDYWNRVKVDANSNKRFDEVWEFKKDGTVERRVAPNDDQNYTQTFRLEGTAWVAKK